MVVSALLCSAIAYILVSPARALGGGLQAQSVDVRSKVEGPIDCKSICDPGGTPYNRNVEALQFLKRIWVPDDKNPINLTAVAKRRIFFGDGKFSLEYDEEEEVRNLAIKNPPPKGMVVTVQQMSCVLRCLVMVGKLVLIVSSPSQVYT
ncbi:unnamed protein product [Symbiodinium sp. CCMP2456]|nr:unnamed protein product [Symbiodinium sp. CCMP2456]